MLFNDDVSKYDYEATNNRITNRKERTTKLLLPLFRYYSRICLEDLRKAANTTQYTSSSPGLNPGYVSSWTIRNQPKKKTWLLPMEQHPANRTPNPQLHTRPATCKPKRQVPQAATICKNLELLMMGIMVPETCWANSKFCNKKTNLLHLIDLLFPRINDDARSNSHQPLK